MSDRPKAAGLWRNADFVKLWGAQTVATFGALMGALQFTAVLVLDASAGQMALLAGAGVAPALAVGLVAGVWVDRLRRRPILICANLGRAILLGSIPIAYFLGVLYMEHLYLVAFVNGAMAIFFDVALPSYVPSVVRRDDLIEANSKIAATDSIVEVGAFSLAGWIVQLLSAMAAVSINALTFIVSALLFAFIRRAENAPPPRDSGRSVRRELVEGLGIVRADRILRAIMVTTVVRGVGGGIIGAVILLFGIRDLGFQPGVLGMIWAVGGVSALVGAVLAEGAARRWGVGGAMTLGLAVSALSTFLIPLAHGPLVLAGAFLVAQQLAGDGGLTVYNVNEISLRQSITQERARGRVNAAIRFAELSALLVGSLAAGVLGEALGLRLTLAAGAMFSLAGAMLLLASPIRSLRTAPASAVDQPEPASLS